LPFLHCLLHSTVFFLFVFSPLSLGLPIQPSSCTASSRVLFLLYFLSSRTCLYLSILGEFLAGFASVVLFFLPCVSGWFIIACLLPVLGFSLCDKCWVLGLQPCIEGIFIRKSGTS